MDSSPPSSVLLERYRQGDAEAWNRLLERYSQRLIEVCRRRVGPAIAGRHDPEDVAQSALGSFLRGLDAGTLHVNSTSELWRLLVVIAVSKAAAYARKAAVARHAPVSLETSDALASVFSDEPGPEEIASFQDLVRHLLDGLPERCGAILQLLLADHTVEEAARRIGVSRHTVYRVRDLFQQRMHRLHETQDPENKM